jgi:hypothetical protein
MYRIAKILHLLGLALFLGSIFAHIVAGQIGGGPGSAHFAFARAEISAATRALTMPGLLLALLSGLWMAVLTRLSPLRQPWLAFHAGLALVVLAIAATLVIPAGKTLLAGGGLDEMVAALTVEQVAGAINIALTLALAAIGVFKPKWGFARRAPNL